MEDAKKAIFCCKRCGAVRSYGFMNEEVNREPVLKCAGKCNAMTRHEFDPRLSMGTR